ncbi:MAG TPA: hypothetical protein PKH51_05655 [Candidatus Sumerlaeota bacterium]|nr:hypothetical protein [Candidatus Sumerlaeota bacterium]
METLNVTCPDCKNVLVVNKKTGQVIEVRRPILEDSTGDRFEDARQKVLDSKNRAEKLFQEAKQKEKDKFAKLDALFKEKRDELKDKPIEKPDRPIDLD